MRVAPCSASVELAGGASGLSACRSVGPGCHSLKYSVCAFLAPLLFKDSFPHFSGQKLSVKIYPCDVFSVFAFLGCYGLF